MDGHPSATLNPGVAVLFNFQPCASATIGTQFTLVGETVFPDAEIESPYTFSVTSGAVARISPRTTALEGAKVESPE
jgi:hypothetical protein